METPPPPQNYLQKADQYQSNSLHVHHTRSFYRWYVSDISSIPRGFENTRDFVSVEKTL